MTAPLPDELHYLISAFYDEVTGYSSSRSKAYLVLSSFCQGVRATKEGKQEDSFNDRATTTIVQSFAPLLAAKLNDSTEMGTLQALRFVHALFHVDPEAASVMFTQDSGLETIVDLIDLGPSQKVSQAIADLLNQASGHKRCRQVISADIIQWLRSKNFQKGDLKLYSTSAVALIKLNRGLRADQTNSGLGEDIIDESSSARSLVETFISETDTTILADLIEGFAYLSTEPKLKDNLAHNHQFLVKFIAMSPKSKSSTNEELEKITVYGIYVVLSHLCAYPSRLTDEETQIERLRQMAKAKTSGSAEVVAADTEEKASDRCRALLAAGCLEVLAAAPMFESASVRSCAFVSYLALAEEKSNRGRILQSGGSKSLIRMLRQTIGLLTKNGHLSGSDLVGIQALSKLAITSAPLQVFGPEEGQLIDAIRPFALTVLHPAATSLQQFEAIMALINLSSSSPEVATRIGAFEGVASKLEVYMLDTHVLLRRASVELVCNLIAGSDEVFASYGGSNNVKGVKTRIHVLLAMCDVDDTPTRMAGSGALATVTSSSIACDLLWELWREKQGRVLQILASLVDPTLDESPEIGQTDQQPDRATNPGLVHRGIIIMRNFFASERDAEECRLIAEEASQLGLTKSLVGLIKRERDPNILQPAAETLRILLEHMKQ